MIRRKTKNIARHSAARISRAALGTSISGRRREILDVAAALFAARGYAATSMRDIGNRVGLLGGSLYHHIRSKESLFVEIHDLALDAAALRIRAAIAPYTEPWDRLEAACVELLEVQLNPHSLTMPLMNDFRSAPPAVRQRLVVKRDQFELLFDTLVRELPLNPALNRKVFRLMLLTLLNSINTWYKPSGRSPAELGRQVALIFRQQARQ